MKDGSPQCALKVLPMLAGVMLYLARVMLRACKQHTHCKRDCKAHLAARKDCSSDLLRSCLLCMLASSSSMLAPITLRSVKKAAHPVLIGCGGHRGSNGHLGSSAGSVPGIQVSLQLFEVGLPVVLLLLYLLRVPSHLQKHPELFTSADLALLVQHHLASLPTYLHTRAQPSEHENE